MSQEDDIQKEIDSAKRKAEKRYHQFTAEEIAIGRRKCKTNLFFLGHSILGYDKFANLHLEVCKWAKATLNEKFRELLLPRSHYKSTLFTISDSIQIVLPDDIGDQPYPRNLGPNTRVLISHETSEAAARFLHSITGHFISNPLLMGLFPECVPNPRQQRINKLELELPRNSIWSEPTIDTVGVAGRSQGRHYNYIKCDDIYGAAARDSKAERESTILWVDNLQSLLISPKSDHIDFVGTRWAHDDVYNHIHKIYGSKLVKYIRACEEYVIENGQKVKRPIFPEEFATEDLEILKKNRVVWNAQYANNPFEGGSKFDPAWLRFYNWAGTSRNRKVVKFNGAESAETTVIDTDEMDRIILIDPAMSGSAGFLVTGTDPKMDIYILEAMKKEWKPPELIEEIFKQVLKWRPRIVAIEEVLFSGLFQHWLQREMQVRGIQFKIVPVKTGGRKKEARVLGLSNYFSSGQIYFNESQKDLIEEYYEFGATEDYHMLDALAYGPELWRVGVNTKKLDYMRQVEAKFMEGRDPQTGYGSY